MEDTSSNSSRAKVEALDESGIEEPRPIVLEFLVRITHLFEREATSNSDRLAVLDAVTSAQFIPIVHEDEETYQLQSAAILSEIDGFSTDSRRIRGTK